MRLHVTNVQKSDYGSYKCVAKNPRGEMDGTIKLYMSSPPTTIPPPTTTTLSTTTTTFLNELNMGLNIIEPTHATIGINKLGIKYQSNLNEIDKSEQKLMGDTPKGYDWSNDKHSSAAKPFKPLLLPTGHCISKLQCLTLIWILRFVCLRYWNVTDT